MLSTGDFRVVSSEQDYSLNALRMLFCRYTTLVVMQLPCCA